MEFENSRIESLQALRGICFLGIFLGHAHSSIKWPGISVSVFLGLSGFLLIYKYYDKDIPLSLSSCWQFAKKIKKLYSLHVITTLAVLILFIGSDIIKKSNMAMVIKHIVLAILNLALVQSWVPDIKVNHSMNIVAWYLSTLVFLYFIFPIMLKIYKKKSIKSIGVGLTIFWLTEIVSCILLLHVVPGNNHAYIWYQYCFPVFRLIDFGTGGFIGLLYVKKGTLNISDKFASLLEILLLILTIGASTITGKSFNSIFMRGIWNATSLFVPLMALWIYLFVANKGIVVKAINNSLLVKLGNISGEAYLIHNVVTSYFFTASGFLGVEIKGLLLIVVIILLFTITIILTLAYRKITQRCMAYKSDKVLKDNK